MPTQPQALARADRTRVLEKCNTFGRLSLWPRKAELDPDGWLENFGPSEIEHALYLLDSFVHYSRDLLAEVFAAGVHNLSSSIPFSGRGFCAARDNWDAFLDRVVLTFVTGEEPNPTDSGQGFARLARKDLGIAEERIVDPSEAVQLLAADPSLPILFVDDFVGSGNQFIETFHRPYAGESFRDVLAREPLAKVFYCPALCTVGGLQRIEAAHLNVQVSPGNVVPREYSALHPASIVWPDHLRLSGPKFVEAVSRRAGIPDDDSPNDWRGYARLGLALSLGDSVPDATLPIFHWEKSGWRPLVRRG